MPFSGHSRTIIGVEQRASGLTLLVLDPSHGPRQVAALGSSRDSLRLIRRNMTAMRAPQYQIVAVRGLFETEEQYQVSGSHFHTYFTLAVANSTLGDLPFLRSCFAAITPQTEQFFFSIFLIFILSFILFHFIGKQSFAFVTNSPRVLTSVYTLHLFKTFTQNPLLLHLCIGNPY